MQTSTRHNMRNMAYIPDVININSNNVQVMKENESLTLQRFF